MIADNVFKRVAGKSTKYTSAIVLTHNVDFVYLQWKLMVMLRRHGSPKLTVFADAACAAGSFRRERHLLASLGQAFRVVPVDMGQYRRFHPKALLLAGPERVRLAIGSGNVGQAGWSNNREVWTYFEFPEGDGGDVIAAFRDYLSVVLQLVPENPHLDAAVLDTFRSSKWSAALPSPGRLLTSPSETPLLDRMVEQLEPTSVASMDVLVPYFDDEAKALTEVAQRLGRPIRVMVQPGRVGISRQAASNLPQNVAFVGVNAKAGDRIQRIHAKLYAARDPEGVTVFSGSANCSKAALLSGTGAGNAELMTVMRLAHEEYEVLISDITVEPAPPVFPEAPLNEEFEDTLHPLLRILSARYENGYLTVSYRLDSSITADHLVVVAGSARREIPLPTSNPLSIEIPLASTTVVLETSSFGDTPAHSSAPMWIDQEALLGRAAPEHRIRTKLASRQGVIDLAEMAELFEHFADHTETSQSSWSRGHHKQKDHKPSPYRLEDAFSDKFGVTVPRLGGASPASGPDLWALFHRLFRTASERPASNPPSPPDEESGSDGGDHEEGKPATPVETKDYAPAIRKHLERAARRVSSEAFLRSRPPQRSASDIQTCVILLAVARRYRLLPAKEIDTFSSRIFGALIGLGEGPGTLQRFLRENPELVGDFWSPTLAATITFWLSELIASDNQDQLNLSVTLLAQTIPWALFSASEKVKEELLEIARLLSEPDLEVRLPEIWLSWSRSTAALQLLRHALEAAGLERLRPAVVRSRVEKGELIWQEGFYVAMDAFERGKRPVHLAPLEGGEPKRYVANMTVPLADVLEMLPIPDDAKELSRSLTGSVPKSMPAAS
jgi:hypothetical protein